MTRTQMVRDLVATVIGVNAVLLALVTQPQGAVNLVLVCIGIALAAVGVYGLVRHTTHQI